MGLLYDAAIAWSRLHDTIYDFHLGRKGKSLDVISLDFCPEAFPHLAGMQYAADIDFGLNRAEIYGGKFVSKIINKEVNDELIEKAADWEPKIRSRLEGIIALENALDNEFLIYRFDAKRVPHGSNIAAKYVIKDLHTGVTFFIFVDEGGTRWFCRSLFQLNIADYTENQARVTVLKKRKRKNKEVVFDYTHRNYRPPQCSGTDGEK